MDELKQIKLNILKGKIKEINDIESQEQTAKPMLRKTLKAAKKSVASQSNNEEQKALRRKKGMLVQLMYYINKRDFRLNNQK